MSSGATRTAIQADGKRRALKDVLAICAMMAEHYALHDLTTEIGSWSNGEVFISTNLMSHSTSDAITHANDFELC